MVRTKTVARKAGGGTVSGGFPTPTQPVLTQDVEAEVARATEAAQHVARLRAMLHGDGSEDGDDDEAVVVSSRPNAPKAKRSRIHFNDHTHTKNWRVQCRQGAFLDLDCLFCLCVHGTFI